METIVTIIEFATMIVVIMLCGISAWLYVLEIVKKIKSAKKKRLKLSKETDRKTVFLLIGGVIEDYTGILWKRTSIRDDKFIHADNYYYIPVECYCNKHGTCDYCESMARQINGSNDAIKVDFNDQSLFKG